MKDYLLDTNMISAMLKQNDQVMKKAEVTVRAGVKIFISTINYYEIKRGLLATQATQKTGLFNRLRNHYQMLGTDAEEVLNEAAEIYANLKRRGQLLPDADILIAAVARRRDLILVTDDGHFGRIEGLSVENWLRQSAVE
jgi:tRNA(fMet)-specific endonuclease VapC